MGRAHPLTRRAIVADTYVRADRLGAELARQLFGGCLESGPVVRLSCDMRFAFYEIQLAIGEDLGHFVAPSYLSENVLLRCKNPNHEIAGLTFCQ